jgi:hypothetical protein
MPDGSCQVQLACSEFGQPCVNGSLLPRTPHFLNEMVPMRIFNSRHAWWIVDIHARYLPEEPVEGKARFVTVTMFDIALTPRSPASTDQHVVLH